MDSVLKAAQKAATQHAAKLQEHATKMQKNASQLIGVEGPSFGDGARDYEFGKGPLGFTLKGMTVETVIPGSQAETLGLEVGDRIVAIATYAVPQPQSAADVAGAEKAARTVKQWIKDTPRPTSNDAALRSNGS